MFLTSKWRTPGLLELFEVAADTYLPTKGVIPLKADCTYAFTQIMGIDYEIDTHLCIQAIREKMEKRQISSDERDGNVREKEWLLI